MTLESNDVSASRDAAYWAKPVERLRVGEVPRGAVNLNVDGRRVVGPIQGFGKLWQKTFRVRLSGASVTPADVVREWKSRFTSFWPAGSTFYAPLAGISPGEVALISLGAMPAPVRLSTGVLVLYADDESFTLITPEGHVLAGWITFSAYQEGDVVVAQAQALERTNDPLYELGAMVIGHRMNNRFWAQTVRNLALHFGVADPRVESQVVCVDGRWQWSHAANLWQNAAIRSGLYISLAPLRWARQALSRVSTNGAKASLKIAPGGGSQEELG